MCIRGVLNQTKNGWSAWCALSMKPSAAVRNSRSAVSMRLRGQRTTRGAHAAFPGGQLAALERRHAAVGIGDRLGTVVGGEGHDRVVELALVLELLQHQA